MRILIKQRDAFLLEFSSNYNGSPDLIYQATDQWIPRPGVIRDNMGNFLRVDYSYKNLFSRYYYDEKTNKVKIIDVDIIEILSAEILEENKIKINSQSYFYTTKGWELLNLVATYQKK